jgi:hypothetical protein
VALFSQKWLCAGCGMRVDQRYATSFRFCHYLGITNSKIVFSTAFVRKRKFVTSL